MPDPKGLVRVAQLRAHVASLARGGDFELASLLLAELTRADLALGLTADGLLRARQAAQLAAERGESLTAPMLVLAAALLAAGAHGEAIAAAETARAHANERERERAEAMGELIAGAAHRRDARLVAARVALDRARAIAARAGESAVAALALVELGWVDVDEDRAVAAATCFEFGAELFRRGRREISAVETDVLAIAARAAAGDVATATARAPHVSDAARAVDRRDLVAFVDGVLAELAVVHVPTAAVQACALAAESAAACGHRELHALARLRQARASHDSRDRARHLEAGLELIRTLPAARAGARLGAMLVALFEDAARGEHDPDPVELARVATALETLPDPELVELARAVLAHLG